MQLTDTHCHIHSKDYPLEAEGAYKNAIEAGVTKLICVGTDADDSKLAAKWVLTHENAWASVGIHPHEAKHGIESLELLLKDTKLAPKIVAVGEIGLDYHYMHSPQSQQIVAFEAQLQLALDYHLPAIFHVRESYEDFWPIVSNFHGVRGVLHSFSDNEKNLQKALAKDLYIGINGIVTFSKSEVLQAVLPHIPLHKLLLETDAPYLTPAPHRGKVNQPVYVGLVAERISKLCSISVSDVARQTSDNAAQLFHI